MLKLLTMGALCGLRSIAPLALLSRRMEVETGGAGTCCGLGTASATAVLGVMALGEMVADKTPWIGPRTAALPVAARASTGAAVGWLLAREAGVSPASGAAVAAAAAVGATYGAYHLRRAVGDAVTVGDGVVGLAEDALVLGAACALTAPRTG